VKLVIEIVNPLPIEQVKLSSTKKALKEVNEYKMEFNDGESLEPIKKKVFIFLLEESLKENKFKCQYKSGLDITFGFRMDDKNIKKPKEIVKPLKTDINLSLVKQITITTEFLIKVTVMRRILNDLNFYLNIRNIKLDFMLLFWSFLLIFKPVIFVFLISFYLYFFVDMHSINHNILTKMLYYFSEFVDKDDEKKNLIHLQKTQSGKPSK
jgi:hypothetical protein